MHRFLFSILVAAVFIAGAQISFASDDFTVAPGPKAGIASAVVKMKDLANSPGSNKGGGREFPLGYEVSQQAMATLKGSSGGGSGSGWTGGSTWHTQIGNGVPAALIGTSFDGAAQYGHYPYDAAIAVGKTYVLALCNCQFAIYDKSTHALVGHIVQLKTFYDTLTKGDTKCVYDSAYGMFVMELDCNSKSQTTPYVDIAVAPEANISDTDATWYVYHFDWSLDGTQTTNNFADYPSLGYDDSAIYVGTNQFSLSGGGYQYSKVRVLSKAQLYNGAAATYTDFVNLLNADGTSAFTVKAGRGLTPAEPEFLLNTRSGGGSSVTLWRITGAPSNPVLARTATVTVGSYIAPPNARQAGTTTGVASGSCFTQDLVIWNGKLYTAFTEGYSVYHKPSNLTGDGIRYLNIDTAGKLLQDVSYYEAGYDRYYPAVTVDNAGNVFMVFSQSDANSYASMWYTGWKTTESSFEVAGEVYAGCSDITDGRWGDYNGIANDPTTPAEGTTAVWLYCGYAGGTCNGGATGSFGTRIVSSSFNNIYLPKPLIATENFNGVLNVNYPNPFSSSTTISYTLSAASPVRITLVDAMGRVAAVIANGAQTAGKHTVEFSPGNLPAGVYFCRLEAEGTVSVRRISLIR